jgi:hypothetical protein
VEPFVGNGYPRTSLTSDGTTFTATGAIPPQFSLTCNGAPDASTWQLTFTIAAARFDPDLGRYVASRLVGGWRESSTADPSCGATAVAYAFDVS